MNEFHELVKDWETFALLIGTAGATLAGLMFVAITFAGERLAPVGTVAILRSHTDPALVAFLLCLVLSALLLIPDLNRSWCGGLLVLAGLAQAVYIGVVLRHLMQAGVRQTWDASDWTWYAVAPVVSAGLLVVSGWQCLTGRATLGLHVLGVALLLLLGMGIRNAWDMVTFTLVRTGQQGDGAGGDQTQPQRESDKS